MPRAGLDGRIGAAVLAPPMSGPCMGFGDLLGVTCQYTSSSSGCTVCMIAQALGTAVHRPSYLRAAQRRVHSCTAVEHRS